ncbi:glycosyltransferase family 4 protein [Arthrobacter sp. zg-Y769]|uniref:glycosyltransferase family 4 protein n=1 Tax=Arthrobacter sp. zg-Y769 TaxID=2894191 RepID=UPI001E39C49A|nr:glycosyltransferase family 4 protein [Arthrobacter sp. zg-Y769]
MAENNVTVTVITDTTAIDLGPNVTIRRTVLGGRLLAWTPTSRIEWYIRHLAQITVFTIASSVAAIPMKMKGAVIFNHNCESLVGQILVMHNVFTAELQKKELSAAKTLLAVLAPVRLLRVSKENVLSLPIFKRKLVSVSEQARKDISQLNVEPERIFTIANGVDVAKYGKTNEIKPVDSVVAWAQPDIQDIVLFIGHQWKHKGLDELLEAMALLSPEFGLVVVGGASQDLELYERRSAQLNISRRVLFAGTWQDVRGFLAPASVFCLPSHGETMPLVALEALAAGVPVVLTPECPASQFIIEGVNGCVTNHTPSDIAAAILRSSKYGSTPADQAAIRTSVADCDWSSVGDKYIDLARQQFPSKPSASASDLTRPARYMPNPSNS